VCGGVGGWGVGGGVTGGLEGAVEGFSALGESWWLVVLMAETSKNVNSILQHCRVEVLIGG
jgi:hypothetical protein